MSEYVGLQDAAQHVGNLIIEIEKVLEVAKAVLEEIESQ